MKIPQIGADGGVVFERADGVTFFVLLDTFGELLIQARPPEGKFAIQNYEPDAANEGRVTAELI